MDIKKKEKIEQWIAISVLIIIISMVIIVVIKYQVDGEKNMPFKLSKITVISTAEGKEIIPEDASNTSKWNMNINQNNDIYFFIDKNNGEEGKSIINSVRIENIEVIESPDKGEVELYMPNSGEGRTFICDDQYKITDSLTYNGGKTSNEKSLEISNQGGKILLRIANTNIGKYESNEDAEIVHDGTLISKIDTTIEEIKFKVNFDIIITIDNINYKANITLEMPCGNIIEQGTSTLEKTDMSDVVFKRV